jgi:hypothetical protein
LHLFWLQQFGSASVAATFFVLSRFRFRRNLECSHNKELASKMPALDAKPGDGLKPPLKTYTGVFVGTDAFLGGQGGRKAPDGFFDRVRETLAIFEAMEDVVWTAPKELNYAANKPLPEFGNWYANGFNAIFSDASVRLFPHKMNEATMRALISAAGGEAVDRDSLGATD